MSALDVPGARLHYEVRGSGPLVILVPGATGTAASFAGLAERLAEHVTALTYDRRGFSASTPAEGPGPDRLDTDADDVHRLTTHLGAETARVFGASSGAIVALHALACHPQTIAEALAFEPPLVRALPDAQRWLDVFTTTYELYQRHGIPGAMAHFREHAFPDIDRQLMQRAHQAAGADDATRADAVHWFEHELRQYPATDPGRLGLTSLASRITLLAGRESRGHPAGMATYVLGRTLDRPVVETPGGHLGHLSHPDEFADVLLGTLRR